VKNVFFSSVKNFRYERKFYIEGVDRERVELMVKLHPALFREIYHERRVNNIYFDSFNFHHYFDNLDGIDRRIKVRIRWYGDTFNLVESPILELKLKHNFHVGKLLYNLKSFKPDKSLSIDSMRRIFKESSLPGPLNLHLMELNFSLLNSYLRKYFLSSNHKYRITIDTDMQTYKLLPSQNSFLWKTTDHANTILELKYNKPYDEGVSEITNFFPFRMTRSSKYMDGIEKLYI